MAAKMCRYMMASFLLKSCIAVALLAGIMSQATNNLHGDKRNETVETHTDHGTNSDRKMWFDTRLRRKGGSKT